MTKSIDDIVEFSAEDETQEPAKAETIDDIVDITEVEAEAIKPDVEEVKETTETEEPAPEPEKPDEELLKQAAEAGVTKSQIKDLDAQSLQRVVRKLNSQFPVTSDAAPTSDATESPVEAKSGKQYALKVSEDSFDTELIASIDNTIGELATDSQTQIQQLITQNKSLMADQAVREEREANVRFDNMISGLTDYQEEFGTDTPSRVQQASRNELRSDMSVLQSGREAEGLPALNEEQLRNKALAGLYPDKPKQLAREEITDKLKVRKNQIIAKPSNSKGPRRNPKQNALRNIAEKMAEFGAREDTTESDAEILESLAR